MKRIVVLVTTLMCSGCGGLLKPPADLDHDARVFMDLVRRDRLESALASLRTTAPPDSTIALLAQARDLLKPFPAESTKLIGWNVFFGENTTGTLTYEAHAHDRTALLVVTVVRAGPKGSEIRAFRWQETAKPLAQVNAFTLSGKTAAHYVFLLLAIVAVVLCVGGAIFAGIHRMGIPWILFCLVGLGSASIDWSTGQQHYNPIAFHLFGAGYVRRGDVAPWIVTWSLPLGTLLMLAAWRRRQRARGRAGEPEPSSLSVP